MPSYWRASVQLTDEHYKTTSMRLQIGELSDVDFETEAGAAQDILDAFITDLKAITGAAVTKITLTVDDPSGSEDTGAGGGGSDVSEELVLIVYTDDPDQVGEVDRLRVPAPLDSVWVNDNYEEGFDLTDALASAYVANFTDGAMEFSDSEHVDDALGTNGIKAGFWRSRKAQIRLGQ